MYKAGSISIQDIFTKDHTLSNIRPYGYETSDLKELYLSRQQLDSQKHVSKYIIKPN